MAAERVFAIPELQENILSRAPIRDILILQRVCKTWKVNTERSLKLQRLLFFEPVKGGCLIHRAKVSIVHHARWGRDNEHRRAFVSPAHTVEKPMTIYANPLLRGLMRELKGQDPLASSEERLTLAHRRPEASWRRMLVTQPACNTKIVLSSPGNADVFEIALQDKCDGIRAGDFFDAVQTECIQKRQSPAPMAALKGWTMFKKLKDNTQIEELPKEVDGGVWDAGVDCYGLY